MLILRESIGLVHIIIAAIAIAFLIVYLFGKPVKIHDECYVLHLQKLAQNIQMHEYA